MKSIYILLISCLIFFCNSSEKKQNKKQPQADLKIIGYVAGYEDFDPSDIDASKLTHINYAFANIIDGNVNFELPTDSLKIAHTIALKKQNPDLKVMFSIGGWVWSDQFSTIAAYNDSRVKFAKSAVALMQYHGFDGIDVDWEFPGQRGEDNIFSPKDKENFTLLLAELRKQLELESAKTNTHYLLTIATGANQAYIDNTDLGTAHQYLDFINIMCYDFYNGWFNQTGHHGNLYPSTHEKFNGNSGLEAVERHLKAGVPAEKLIMGIPFYGRRWEHVTPENNGLYQTSKTTNSIVATWKIKEELKSDKFQEFYDDSAKASYLWNAQDSIFISWETPKEIKLKSDFIKEKGLGGAMFWEYSLDDNKELLNTLYNSIR
ncbi:chitinase [Tamlana nanhaiensis]|uniref:chitinase n=1 Tax=Neotamlana nanhaiensis TaxID=1382798 RepID=A0A0D7VWF1_9FLAO|nr:glycoside hydrolase family 18 protein [Tamlana nanhaiensis]KJD31181.1 chitinase [Tamlana nanhaiensis]